MEAQRGAYEASCAKHTRHVTAEASNNQMPMQAAEVVQQYDRRVWFLEDKFKQGAMRIECGLRFKVFEAPTAAFETQHEEQARHLA